MFCYCLTTSCLSRTMTHFLAFKFPFIVIILFYYFLIISQFATSYNLFRPPGNMFNTCCACTSSAPGPNLRAWTVVDSREYWFETDGLISLKVRWIKVSVFFIRSIYQCIISGIYGLLCANCVTFIRYGKSLSVYLPVRSSFLSSTSSISGTTWRMLGVPRHKSCKESMFHNFPF
jgi:hypothetical protein